MPLDKRPLRPKGLTPGPRPSGRKSNYHQLCLDAQRFVTEKDYTTALTIYTKALQEPPAGDQKALKGVCRCYRKLALRALKKEDFKGVQSLLEAMIALPKVSSILSSKDYCVLAEAALENGDIAQANQAVAKALEINPTSSEALQRQKHLRAELLHQQMKDLY